jgi:ATP-dependent DNA helicase RecG
VVSFLADDPVRRAAERALNQLAAGRSGEEVETDLIDCKEDPARRAAGGDLITPGPAQSDRAAVPLTDAAACMSNSGGGAVIVGVDDKTNRPVGTDLDDCWLRGRIHQLTDGRLTCAVEPVFLRSTRLLVIIAPPAQEPIRVRGKAKHRVGRRCVEIDASTWMSGHLRRLGYDWSAQSSGIPASSVRPAAVDVARRYLVESGEPGAADLAALEWPDLLRRLGAVDSAGLLTNGGALLFTARAERVLLDYRRRDHAGGDSLLRLDRSDAGLLEALRETEQAIAQANRAVHVWTPATLAVGQVRAVPDKAIREALANAVAHREWTVAEPVVVEFAGDTLVVQSPGGFVEGVDTTRLLTTPPRARNPHLADVLRRLRIAEREGVGVDRMYRELIRVGHRPPEIVERPGPHVRCAIMGGDPNALVLRLALEADPPIEDVDIALIVDQLRRSPAVSAEVLVDVLQKPIEECAAALLRAQRCRFRADPLIDCTARTRRWRRPEYRYGRAVRSHFGQDLPYFRNSRDEVVPYLVDFVRRHGRIQTSDYVELFGVSQPYASTVLRELASDDAGAILAPGRLPNRGRTAHYVAGPGFPDMP